MCGWVLSLQTAVRDLEAEPSAGPARASGDSHPAGVPERLHWSPTDLPPRCRETGTAPLLRDSAHKGSLCGRSVCACWGRLFSPSSWRDSHVAYILPSAGLCWSEQSRALRCPGQPPHRGRQTQAARNSGCLETGGFVQSTAGGCRPDIPIIRSTSGQARPPSHGPRRFFRALPHAPGFVEKSVKKDGRDPARAPRRVCRCPGEAARPLLAPAPLQPRTSPWLSA